ERALAPHAFSPVMHATPEHLHAVPAVLRFERLGNFVLAERLELLLEPGNACAGAGPAEAAAVRRRARVRSGGGGGGREGLAAEPGSCEVTAAMAAKSSPPTTMRLRISARRCCSVWSSSRSFGRSRM